MEFEGFFQVREEVRHTVIAGIQMILVLNARALEFPMQSLGTFFEAEIVLLATVEVDGELSQASFVLSCQDERTVLLPVRRVNRLSKNRAQQAA